MLIRNGIDLRNLINEGYSEKSFSYVPHFKLVTYIANYMQQCTEHEYIEDFEKAVFSIIQKLSSDELRSTSDFLHLPDDVVKSDLLSMIESCELFSLMEDELTNFNDATDEVARTRIFEKWMVEGKNSTNLHVCVDH
tara:strand:- start:54 stop:464 length:411 start_codon:yes stop_codon:yes gene_type:complete